MVQSRCGSRLAPKPFQDGRWLVVSAHEQELTTTQATQVFPVAGGPPVLVYAGDGRLKWHRDASVIVLSVGRPTERGPSAVPSRSYIIPLPAGRSLPDVPPEGFQSEAEIAKLPGVSRIESADAAPGPTAGVYAYSREAVQRNLYRIPLP